MVMDESAESHSIAPRCGEIGDFDSRIAFGDVLAPFKKILPRSRFSDRSRHRSAALLILHTEKLSLKANGDENGKLPDLAPKALALI